MDPAASALSAVSPGSPPPSRHALRLGSSLSPCGAIRLELLLLPLDPGTPGSSVSLKGHLRLESILLVLELATSDPPLLLRTFAQLDFSSMILAGAQVDFLLFVLGATHSELVLLLRGCARLAGSLSILSFVRCGSSLLPRCMACTELLLFVLGVSCLAVLPLAFAATSLDFTTLLKSMA